MDLFEELTHEIVVETTAQKLNRLIASGRTKEAIELLRTSQKNDVFESLGRNRFTICGNSKSEIIDYVQGALFEACRQRKSIKLIV